MTDKLEILSYSYEVRNVVPKACLARTLWIADEAAWDIRLSYRVVRREIEHRPQDNSLRRGWRFARRISRVWIRAKRAWGIGGYA